MLTKLPGPKDAFPPTLPSALAQMGDYVYAYYRRQDSGAEVPFYVGKGTGTRVLAHWKNAVSSPRFNMDQEKEIARILHPKGDDRLPVVRLLAYNLEKTPRSKVYSVAERVLQDAFGIQKVLEKRIGGDRIYKRLVSVSTLLQVREDSKQSPVLSLEAVIAKSDKRKTLSREGIAALVGAPILVVGLSKTYHPSYSEGQLAEMARMYWNLDSQRTRYPDLKSAANPALIAWSTKLNGAPMIVGAWRIREGSFRNHRGFGRQSFKVTAVVDLELRRQTIGLRLTGDGNSNQGQHIALP